jgi:tetratricopeptide (TPR) repeat protein
MELFKISDSSFISREQDQIIQFKTNPADGKLNIVFYDIDKPGPFEHARLDEGEKVPYEFLLDGDFDKALMAYKSLLSNDSKDESVSENNLNQQGYELLRQNQTKLALDVFKINMLFYPNSANTYDSYAEACMKNGDTTLAIANYKKSLELNPENNNAVKMLEELQGKK